jgi:hypothetical protein
MDKKNYLPIEVPRRPARLGLDRPNYGWRTVGWLCLGCAAASGVVWLVLR